MRAKGEEGPVVGALGGQEALREEEEEEETSSRSAVFR